MNLTRIDALNEQVKLEAQQAVERIYQKYNDQMNGLISEQIPVSHKVINGNGMCLLVDETGREVNSGRAWGLVSQGKDAALNSISDLQYPHDFIGGFCIESNISSSASEKHDA